MNPVLGEANIPADATEFMNSTGAWANDGDKSITGLDKDLWVGGLAEMTNPFGGPRHHVQLRVREPDDRSPER